jgi:hypothetical protein
VGRHPGLKFGCRGKKEEQKMKKMFSSMMERFANGQRATSGGMSEEDKKKMRDFREKMGGMCPCMTGKEMSGNQRIDLREEKKAMAEQMMACCGGARVMMSSFFKKTSSQTDETKKPEKE